jgi:hypothetical protein
MVTMERPPSEQWYLSDSSWGDALIPFDGVPMGGCAFTDIVVTTDRVDESGFVCQDSVKKASLSPSKSNSASQSNTGDISEFRTYKDDKL